MQYFRFSIKLFNSDSETIFGYYCRAHRLRLVDRRSIGSRRKFAPSPPFPHYCNSSLRVLIHCLQAEAIVHDVCRRERVFPLTKKCRTGSLIWHMPSQNSGKACDALRDESKIVNLFDVIRSRTWSSGKTLKRSKLRLAESLNYPE
jgi:hypothetical protein